MMFRRLRRSLPWLCSFAAWLLVSAVAQAASSDAVQRCAGIADDRARLACYDSLFGRPAAPEPAVASSVAEAPAAGAAAATAAVAPAAAPSNPAADFGLSEAAKRAREPEQSREQFPDSVTGTIAEIGRKPAGEFVVTLENGQVWTQLQVDVRARVAVGDTVTIKKAALGSYMLVTASRYATRVRRVR